MSNAPVIVAGIGVCVASVSAAISACALHRTTKAVGESFRSRIDASAPRLAVRVEPPTTARFGDSHDITARAEPWPDMSMDSALEPERRIFLHTWGQVTNEGKSSAFLELPPEATPVDERGEDPIEGRSPRWNMFGKQGQLQPLTLAPGESSWLYLEVVRPLKAWAELWERYHDVASLHAAARNEQALSDPIVIRSFDQYAQGLVDTVTIQLGGLPIAPKSPGSTTYIPVVPPQLFFFVKAHERAYPSVKPKDAPNP